MADAAAIPVGRRTRWVLLLASAVGMVMLAWPLLIPADATRTDPPFLFLALMPFILAVVLAEMSEGGMDARVLALLGVLSAINGILRALSAGTAGIELVFFLLVLGGRVFGAGFGFVLGCLSLFVSGLMTAGVGPWLPFQMLVAGWVGMGAGLLPRRLTGRAELAALIGYGVLAAYAYGLLMNLWGWPFVLGIDAPGEAASGGLAYVAGASVAENLHRFVVYTLLTSTGGWDTLRALTNAVTIAMLGPAVLQTLRRASRRARIHRTERTPAGELSRD